MDRFKSLMKKIEWPRVLFIAVCTAFSAWLNPKVGPIWGVCMTMVAAAGIIACIDRKKLWNWTRLLTWVGIIGLFSWATHDWMSALTVLGLIIFETVSSVDNAVVNADVLRTMGKKGRRIFLTWGIFVAVFVVRGVLPWFIVWMSSGLGPWESLTVAFSGDPRATEAVEKAAPTLLGGGGVFLFALFLHWLLMEPKHLGIIGERLFSRQGAWYFAIMGFMLAAICYPSWVAEHKRFVMVVGYAFFTLSHGAKQWAEGMENNLAKGGGGMSDFAKVLFLELIDICFSIDGVIGSFAFTTSVPLILLGNGIGAIVVRQLTISGVDHIKKMPLLKNGAMWSISVLALVMIVEGFEVHVPMWVSPVSTISVMTLFGVLTYRDLKSGRVREHVGKKSHHEEPAEKIDKHATV